jgi:DNA-binding NarL/FixJ family response regulator
MAQPTLSLHQAEQVRGTLESLKGPAKERIRVLLVDDHVLLRQALQLLLELHEEIEVAGQADNGREAVDAVGQTRVDVVLMDMRMPGLNGVEATRQIRKRSPTTRILIVTGIAEDEQVLEALRAGASGYILKQSDIDELLVAIRAVYRGNPYLSASLTSGRSAVEYLLAAQQPEKRQDADLLTDREREIIQLVAEGHSNQAIADQLVLSVKTVEAHKANIMAKLHVRSLTDMIRYALRKGMISLELNDES